MNRFEGERRPNIENGNIRVVDPGELMRENPAALIVNKESYNRMLGNFTTGLYGQFEPPQVVRVTTYSSEHGVVERLFVLDGLTRTKFVSDHLKDIILPKYPDFVFTVKDVTSSVLNNDEIIPAEERGEGQKSLTMLQYLRAVVPPTIMHSQIAPDRIAAHLINGWQNMVGENLAQRYSALAALSLLGNRDINIATDNGLRKDLGAQPKLMVDETIEERVRLQQALIEMAAIIRQTRLNRQEVAQSAFTLVGEESEVIGGAREARNQIYGLLYNTPEVNRKLEEAFRNISEREQMRQQLGELVSGAFRKAGKTPNKEEVIKVLGMVLRDSNLKFNHIIDIFTSDKPIARYDQVKEGVNQERLTRAYTDAHKLQELSPVEAQLIETLGVQTILEDYTIQGLVKTIKLADTTLQKADEFRVRLATRRDEFIASGCTAQLLDEALPKIEVAQAAITAAMNLATLSRKSQELSDTLQEINRRMNNQFTRHRVGEMVDQASGDKLKEGYGPQIRLDIIGLVIGEFKTIEDRSLGAIRQRIHQLSSLDHDLLLGYKNGNISLSVALQRQREKAIFAQPTLSSKPTPGSDESTVTPPDRFGATARVDITRDFVKVEPPIQQSGLSQSSTLPENVVIDKQRLDERRKQNNRDQLNTLLDSLDPVLRDIDLTPQEITPLERARINTIVKRLGFLGYNHPNTPEVMTESYPRLLEEFRVLREELFAREQRRIDEDKRTKKSS